MGLSESFDAVEAFSEAARDAARKLDAPCDLCLLFAGAPHLGHGKWILSAVHEQLEPRHLIGCGAGGVVGAGREIEEGPAAVVWAASMPGGRDRDPSLRGRAGRGGLRGSWASSRWTAGDCMLVLADPYSFATEALLDRLNDAAPGHAGARRPGERLGGRLGLAVSRRRRPRRRRRRLLAVRRVDPALRLPGRGAGRPRDDDHRRARQRDRGAGLAGRRSSGCARRSASSIAREQQLAASGPDARHRDRREPARVRARRLPRAPDHRRRPRGGHDRARRAGPGRADGPHAHPRRRLRRRGPARARSAPRSRRSAPPARPARCCSPATAAARTCSRSPTTTRSALEDALGVPAGGFFCAGEIGPVGGRNFLHGFTATMAVFAARVVGWRTRGARASWSPGRWPRTSAPATSPPRRWCPPTRAPGRGSCRSSRASSSASRPPREAFAQAGAESFERARGRGRSGATRCPPTSRCASGPARALLAAERTALNLLCHLSGVATLTARFVDAVAGPGRRSSTRARRRPGCGRSRRRRSPPAAGATTAWASTTRS